MFIRRLHNLPILCLLVLFLLSSTASTSGYVWCVSSDGHATLEEAVAGDCGLDHPVTAAAGSAEPLLAIGTDDCGPCLDVSPSYQWGSPRARHDGSPVSVPADFAPVAAVTYTFLPDRFPTTRPVATPTPRTPDPLLHHRTIVLLI